MFLSVRRSYEEQEADRRLALRKMTDRERSEQEALLQVVPHADCPVYTSGVAQLPNPDLYVR